MQTATEQLQAIADQWAAKLGGGIKVRLSLTVYAGPVPEYPLWGASIGETATDFCWRATGDHEEDTLEAAERRWKLDGAPTDPKDAERAKLRARAAELGMTVIENTQQKENCAHC